MSGAVRGVTHGGDVSPPKFELGGTVTQCILCPPKMINIMVKYHAPTKTEQGKLNCYPIKRAQISKTGLHPSPPTPLSPPPPNFLEPVTPLGAVIRKGQGMPWQGWGHCGRVGRDGGKPKVLNMLKTFMAHQFPKVGRINSRQ